MSGQIFAAEAGRGNVVTLTGGNVVFVVLVGAIAVLALAMGMMFRR